jgi:methionyl-tRNA formyltransferase
LPKFRGAAPINHAIIQGEAVTGVTSFLLNDVVDTGTVLLQQTLPIADGMTAGELYASLMPLAAACAVDTCRHLLDGTITPQVQDDALASPAPKVFRETSVINWSLPAAQVRNFVHGHSPVPGAWTMWNGEPLKIFRAGRSIEPCKTGMFRIVDGRMIAGCADGALEIDEIQLPGKRRMVMADVLRGYRGPHEGAFA